MGVAYELLPRFGFRASDRPAGDLAAVRLRDRPALHIARPGLVGRTGVQRKIAGADQVLSGLSRWLPWV